MTDFAHEEVLLFLALLAFGNVLSGADDARGPSLMAGALEISEPQSLHPADLSVSRPEPELGRGALRIDGIERGLEDCPNAFRVVRMHPSLDLLDRRLVSGNVEISFERASPETTRWRGSYCHDPSWAASMASCRRSLLSRSKFSAACRLAAVPRSSAISVLTSATGVPLGGSGPLSPKAIAARAAWPTERAIIRPAASETTACQPGGSAFVAAKLARAC